MRVVVHSTVGDVRFLWGRKNIEVFFLEGSADPISPYENEIVGKFVGVFVLQSIEKFVVKYCDRRKISRVMSKCKSSPKVVSK